MIQRYLRHLSFYSAPSCVSVLPVSRYQLRRNNNGILLERPQLRTKKTLGDRALSMAANITMSERPAKRQRIELSLEKRIESIKYAESVPKPTLIALSGKFGIGKSTVGDILKKECCECQNTRLFFENFTVY